MEDIASQAKTLLDVFETAVVDLQLSAVAECDHNALFLTLLSLSLSFFALFEVILNPRLAALRCPKGSTLPKTFLLRGSG